MKIYLCGGVRKSGDDRKIVWSEKDKEAIKKVIPDAELLDPQTGWEGLDPLQNFGCDLCSIRKADIVMVDARQKRGIGIGAEMAIAKVWKKPVISICPEGTHFRRDIEYYGRPVKGWVHPFLASLSDGIVDDVEQAALWARGFLERGGEIKDGSVFEEAIEHFLGKQGEGK